MKIAMKTFTDEHVDSLLVSIVDITPEFAQFCLDYIQKVRELKQDNIDIFEITLFNYAIDYLNANESEEIEEIFEPVLYNDNVEYLSIEEIDIDTFIKEHGDSVEGSILHISEHSIRWTAYLKHTNFLISTISLSKDFLESIIK